MKVGDKVWFLATGGNELYGRFDLDDFCVCVYEILQINGHVLTIYGNTRLYDSEVYFSKDELINAFINLVDKAEDESG